jgi:purine-binding chemotaxis protein CheW
MTVTHVPCAPDAVIGITNLKGRVITIFNLSELLGRNGKCSEGTVTGTVNAVIFKYFSGGEDQIGLSMDKSGEIIELDDDIVCQPSLTTGAQESFCISGIAELDDKLYRIINIDSIINKFKKGAH